MTFFSDLEFGSRYEDEFVKVKKLTNAIVPKKKNSNYDIIVDNIMYEIKADRRAFKTGNLCIEFECSNKPSGIQTTQSNFYGYFIVQDNNNYTLYTIPVDFIKKEIEKQSYKMILKGGSGYKSKFYLFDKNIFHEFIETI